jgi:hypothetical protein
MGGLIEQNRSVFEEFTVGDKLMITHHQYRYSGSSVDFGVVLGYRYNSMGEMVLSVGVVGEDEPSVLHPHNAMFTLSNLTTEARSKNMECAP